MAYATTDIILWAKISQALASIDEPKKISTTGGSMVKNLAVKLYLERKTLEWEYAQDPTSDNLFQIGNWVFALCGVYGLQAQFLDSGSGVPITPVTPPSTDLPQPLDWIVSGISSATAPLATGESSVYLNGSNSMPNFVGFNMDFTRGNYVQNTTDAGDGTTYYSWDRTTGLFTLLNGAAQASERFRILPTR